MTHFIHPVKDVNECIVNLKWTGGPNIEQAVIYTVHIERADTKDCILHKKCYTNLTEMNFTSPVNETHDIIITASKCNGSVSSQSDNYIISVHGELYLLYNTLIGISRRIHVSASIMAGTEKSHSRIQIRVIIIIINYYFLSPKAAISKLE